MYVTTSYFVAKVFVVKVILLRDVSALNHVVVVVSSDSFASRIKTTMSTSMLHSHVFHVIGRFVVNGVQPQATGDNSKVKVKVRVNIHGVFLVSSASMVEKLAQVILHGYIYYKYVLSYIWNT